MTSPLPRTAIAASLLALGFALSGTLALAEADPAAKPKPTGNTVAVVDLTRIFEGHTRFKLMMADVKADVARADARVRQQGEAIQKLAVDLQKSPMDPQSAEYKAAQEDLAKKRNDLQVQIQLQRKEFLQREAKVYLTVYQEILKAVEEYAKANKIRVVLRSQRGPVNADKPEQVLQHINRAIVWTDDTLDITPIILQKLNRSSAKPEAIAKKPPAPHKPADAAKPATAAKPKPAQSKKPDEKPPAGKPKPAKDRPKTPPKAPPKKPAKQKPKTTPDEAKKPASPDPHTVVRLTITGGYPEGPSSPGLFGDVRPSLRTVIRRIDQAAGDDDVAATVLRIKGSNLGRAKLYELRAAVARLRKAGKPVYAELTSAGTSQYLLASACDEIVIAPAGTLMLPGVRAEATFYKGLMDKLGIRFDSLQMGKYKGAVESFTRTDMSPPLRQSLEALVDDTYEALVDDVAKDRKLEPDQVKTLIDRAFFTAKAAKKAGLVDHVAYPDEFRETLAKKLGADALKLVDNYGRKKPDTDFSGMAGMMKLMQMMFGGQAPAKATRNEKIALIYAVGMIVPGRSTTSIFGEQVLGSTTLVKALQAADKDPKVLAIVLRVDSPGGSALASDAIWRAVTKTEKPIIASLGDVAGSGGYYIAMGADKILAAPETVTGSIGVVGGKFVLGGLYDKIGITTEVISRGKNSGALSSTKPFSKEERKAWMAVMKEVYDQFVAKAAEGRKMPRKKLEALAQGRVYSGRMAAANGLIDSLGTLQEAIAEAKKAAGLKPDQEVELLILPRPRTIFEQLFAEPFTSTQLEAAVPGLGKTLAQLSLLSRLFAEPTLTLMPCRVELK